MSLKVYTGIKFKSKNIQEIIKSINDFKKIALENVINYYCENPQVILKFLLWKLDPEDIEKIKTYINDIKDKKGKVYTEIFTKFKNEFLLSAATSYKSWNDIDFICNIHIIPYRGSYYGWYSVGDIKINEKLISDISDDFYYQNQTDKPDHITTREWNKRRNFWNMACYEKSQSLTGLEFPIVSYNDLAYWDIEKIFDNFINSYELGYNCHFIYDTGVPYPDEHSNSSGYLTTRFSTIELFIEESAKLKDSFPELNISRYETHKSESGTLLGEYILSANMEEYDKVIKQLLGNPNVLTTAEQFETGKKQILVLKNINDEG